MQGLASNITNSNHRFVCMCNDCQAFPQFLGNTEEVLDENGGTEVFPVYPANIKITKGMENLKCVRLSDDGLMRWYAGCCKTPIANTMSSPKLPFASLIHTFLDLSSFSTTRDEVLGPVYARVNAKYGHGKLPVDAHRNSSLKLGLTAMKYLFIGFVKKLNRPSPFFTPDGKPRVEPLVLTDEQYYQLISLGNAPL